VSTVIATSPDRGSPVPENRDILTCCAESIAGLLSSFSKGRISFYLFIAMAVPSLVALSITDA
jgi:hypothetical protein